jgi:Zn-dependent protease
VADTTAELIRASADIPLTRDAREILERAGELASRRGLAQTDATDVLRATLNQPGSLADREIAALGLEPRTIARQLQSDGAAPSPNLRQLLLNANREAQVLGHHQVDSIHLLLAMLYTDSPATTVALQSAGLTLYDLRRHVQSGTRTAAAPAYRDPTRPDASLRRRPWPSLRGVLGISPVFGAIVLATAGAGAILWTDVAPELTTVWTIGFVIGGWVISLCIHEFGHAFVAYLGGDRSVAGAGYLTLNPLRYATLANSLVLPVLFLLIGGIAMPGGAVYINHSALRTRAWSSAVSLGGPLGTLLCGLAIAGALAVATALSWITPDRVDFFGALSALGFFMAFALVLNLVPIPGLDGFGVIRPWLPYAVQQTAMRYSMVAVYAVFLLLWFVAPVRLAFFGFVIQLATLAGIDPGFMLLGQLNMRIF